MSAPLQSRGVLAEVLSERERQVVKGWTPEHDDQHTTEELVSLAVRRARRDHGLYGFAQRRHLIEAAAMLVAAVESMDRRGT